MNPDSEYHHDRHFGVEEARELLPEVKSLLATGVELREQLEEQDFNPVGKMRVIAQGITQNGRPFPPEAIRLASVVNKLEEMGVSLKDLQVGICDFPAIRDNGEEVYLCFRLGEGDIKYFHGLDAGFKGRRPIEEF